tara:strand:+ start:2434 stop:4317 length:1884 start_codon:yes stop_codon:yes gene_type:complete
VADYSVSIKLAVAGAKELDFVNKRTEKLKNTINEINKKAQAGTAGTPVVKNFKNLSKSVLEARDALDEAAVGTKEFNQAVKNLVQVENKFERQQKQKERRLQIQRLAQKESISFSKAKKLLIEQERIAEEKLATAKAKTAKADAKRKFMQGPGAAISSAAIGGAFPLLFGQTGTAAVGGAVGGAAGGLIGGQFGFALSILGTAVGQFIQQQDELDKSLLKISRSFENAGNSSGFTRESFNNLKSTLRMTKDEILAVATEFSRFGKAGESAAFIFGDNPNTFKNLAALRDTKTITTAILDTQNGLSIKQQIQLLREAKVTSFKDMQLRVSRLILEENFKRELSEAGQITNAEKVLDVFKQQLRLITLIKTFGATDLEKEFPDFFKSSAENAEDRQNEIREKFAELLTDLPKLQDLLTELDTQVQGMSFSIPSAIDSVSAELKKLTSTAFIVTTSAQTIGDAFGESFKGIVKGTMTAQDALRNLFQRTADAFLDMAAQMIAKQIQMKILGIGFNFLGSKQVTDTVFTPSVNSVIDNSFELPKLAGGGMAKAGRTHLVGERGPELFTPGVSGMITPNHALGGSTNVVVNVDASGSSVEGDEQQARELGLVLSAAIESELIKQKRPGGLLS